MENHMESKIQGSNKEYTFLVLMDFSEASYIALKYAITIAKLLKGNIHVLHVANPSKIITSDNQVIAMKALELETMKIKNKLKSIDEIISAENITSINQYSIGNIITELELYQKQIHPDLIFVGKKGAKMKFSGKLSDYLLNKYSGSVLIADEETEFKASTKIAFGCNDKMLDKYDPSIIFELDDFTKSPVTLLTVKKSNESNGKLNIPPAWKNFNQKNMEFRCENHESSKLVAGLAEHISDNNIELLCIGRGKPRNIFKNMFFSQNTTMSEIINGVHIPVLLLRYKNSSS